MNTSDILFGGIKAFMMAFVMSLVMSYVSIGFVPDFSNPIISLLFTF